MNNQAPKKQKKKSGKPLSYYFPYGRKNHTRRFAIEDIAANKMGAVLASIGIFFFVPLTISPDSRFGRYWANQGLLVLIADILMLIVGAVSGLIFGLLSLIPTVGIAFTVIKIVIYAVLGLLALVLILLSVIPAANGKAVDLPYFGHIRIIK